MHRAFLLFFLFAVSTYAQKQPEAVPVSDPDALRFAAASARTLGVQTTPVPVVARGKIAYANSEEVAPFELTVITPRVFRTVSQRKAGEVVSVSNEGDGYLSFSGKKHSLGWVNQFGARCPYFPAFSFLGELGRANLLIERVAVKAGENLRIKASYTDPEDPEMADISAVELELDAKTLLPVRLKTIVRPPSNQQIQIHVEYEYDGYQRVGPYVLPTVIRIFSEGQPHSIVAFDTFELNPPVNSTDFEVK
jgi:hypothetical protein